MESEPVHWITCEGQHVAYQVTGRGRATVLLLDFWFSNLDNDWSDPARARVLRRLSSLARLVRFDRSGMGLSDRRPPPP
jgi:pimeloyl-ACP methyl ester carboxylesterase